MKAEQFIKDCTRSCSNETTSFGSYDHTYHEWLTPEQALRAIEIAREELIKKATSYIQQHWIWNTKMIEEFKQAMEE